MIINLKKVFAMWKLLVIKMLLYNNQILLNCITVICYRILNTQDKSFILLPAVL